MIRAIIFDMDGVISDTQKLHASVEEKLLKKHGIKMKAEEITEKFSGVPTKDFFQKLFRDYNVSANIDLVMEEKWKEMTTDAKKGVSAISGAVELIRDLKRHGFKLGVGSSSSKEYAEVVLTKLKIKEEFDAIVTRDDVKHGKPNPETFLLAAKELGMNPKECAVIEDGLSGIVAAKKAKMKSIAFVDKSKKSKYHADLIVDDLKLLTSERINKIGSHA